ncbi:MAG: putative glycan acetyltransferase [bacterium]|nr:MAG: putative glycan acetyltransferase [bacterium]KAF0150173.1 MAG: putative glycan acetyltransferase [bacterium]KAF0169653.1 MAG: putative glycan acetyltransferase [bacterium]TXT22955.1 MAG: putative glycan acetyltransferase [bacterium]
MRAIDAKQISLFFLLLGVIIALAVATTWFALGGLPLGDFRGVVLTAAGILLFYLYAFAVYRLFLWFMPLREGELAEGSREEFAAQVNILFYLMLFNSLIRTHFLPVPLMRLVYQALGTRMGANTYSAGVILDPPLTELGANCIIGHDAVLFSHAIEGRHFALARIRVGDNVTIGATAVIMSGVSIGDGAIVSAGSVVLKDTQIGPGEIWGGVPAKRIK